MDYQDPNRIPDPNPDPQWQMHPDYQPPQAPPDTPATPPSAPSQAPQHSTYTPGFTGRGRGDGGSSGKQRRFSRVVALCLCCALLGGVVGGVAGHYFAEDGAQVQIGSRTPIELTQVSIDSRKQMTVPEVYANYIDSCVGISVDIVTTNSWGVPVTGAAAGSGFVITEDGYIMTNYHVIEEASKITVTFVDDKSYEAKLVGGDRDNDIAIVKIDAKGLKPVVLGDSSQMYVGETVVTIGNPLGELTFSLSDGVVSALERSISVATGKSMKMIQTNCTINSGNSGGPLFNLYGEVIGIVTAKYSASGGFTAAASVEGLGFAIPITNVRDMMSDLIAKGYVTGKPFLGVSVSDVPASVQNYGVPAGAVMVYVTPSLAAAKAGLAEGDIITAVNDEEISNAAELIETVGGHKAGDTITLSVFRSGEKLDLSIVLDEENDKNTKAYDDYYTQQQDKARQEQQMQQNSGNDLEDFFGNFY